MKSDHRPLLLTIGKNPNRPQQRLFRYFAGWTLHKDFHKFVNDNWDSSLSITDAISKFTVAANNWNHSIFGQLSYRKRNVMARLKVIQRYLDKNRSSYLSRLETKLQTELELILDQEEILWKQKSRSDWINFGDRNTTYFHKKAIINKRINRIYSLQISTGDWCSDTNVLRQETSAYFQKLFSLDDEVHETFPISGGAISTTLSSASIGGAICDSVGNWVEERLSAGGLGDVKTKFLGGRDFLIEIVDEELYRIMKENKRSLLLEVFLEVHPWTESYRASERVT
ncbi:uncharacterized protein LOC120195039 [Hibiscus syriacus]|uniref:uncharacterized protein LOC120195039 n=1 Tax=Hibiscus syriacus TaxID=106335 RepID=UPI001923005E|nr:uncharacterized protein LOC120195039 [Hibiscus syriacus]